MISVIVYGRNDSHGYNMHKRVALSLNCIAEVLDDADDEILFVDYNTPDDFPTFLEAIRDTLTAAAIRRLRVFRVRPPLHARVRGESHLGVLEPIARNVALRRSNPANRWVLSSNTDMIFLPEPGASLSRIAADLPAGYYHLPRMELPESLWELLDRRDPAACLATVGAWAGAFHLDTVVRNEIASVVFDGPGDFQLIARQDLMEMRGFDERMTLGWHVDANIAQRLMLRHGRGPGELGLRLRGYHCDHTRQATPAHRANSRENDWTVFVTDVATPLAPNGPDWGFAGEEIEEIDLAAPPRLLAALEAAIPVPQAAVREITLGKANFDRIDYVPAQPLPFLLDSLASQPPATRVGWFPARADLLTAAARGWPRLGMRQPIMVPEGAVCLAAGVPAGTLAVPLARLLAEADVFVLDYGAPADAAAAEAARAGLQAVYAAERARLAMPGAAPRRVIAVNTVGNAAEGPVLQAIGATLAPAATWVRQGFVSAASTLTPLLPGPAGAWDRVSGAVRIQGSQRGLVCATGPVALAPGRYRVGFRFVGHRPFRSLRHAFCAGVLTLEVAAGAKVLARCRRPQTPLLPLGMRVEVMLPAGAPLSVRVFSSGMLAGRIADFEIVAI